MVYYKVILLLMCTVTHSIPPGHGCQGGQKEAKEQGFASTSEFMRHVLRTYKNEKLLSV